MTQIPMLDVAIILRDFNNNMRLKCNSTAMTAEEIATAIELNEANFLEEFGDKDFEAAQAESYWISTDQSGAFIGIHIKPRDGAECFATVPVADCILLLTSLTGAMETAMTRAIATHAAEEETRQ